MDQNQPEPAIAARPAQAAREFRWKPYGLGAAVLVAAFAVAVQMGLLHGAVTAGLLTRNEPGADPQAIWQTAAWAGAPFLLFSLLIEPLVRPRGAQLAVAIAFVLTLLVWSWAGVEAWLATRNAIAGVTAQGNGIYAGIGILVLPVPLFLMMALAGRFLAGRAIPA